MKYTYVLIVMTAMVLMAADSARGITSPGLLMLGSRVMAASALSSLPVVKGDESLSKTIFPAAQNSTVSSVLVTANAEDDKDKEHHQPPPPPPPPPSRSKSCPPPPNDSPRDANCGKGNDGKRP